VYQARVYVTLKNEFGKTFISRGRPSGYDPRQPREGRHGFIHPIQVRRFALFGLGFRSKLGHDIRRSNWDSPMQTLNVGAGRTDEECKAADEQRREELRSDIQTDAFYFFIAAGLAGFGTGVLPLRINTLVNIGAIDLLRFYGRELLSSHPLLLRLAAATWIAVLAALGFGARKGLRWAFWAGVILYAADMLALFVTFSMLAAGVHGFFIFKWFQGQQAVRDLKE